MNSDLRNEYISTMVKRWTDRFDRIGQPMSQEDVQVLETFWREVADMTTEEDMRKTLASTIMV